jgi:hypothetical protein
MKYKLTILSVIAIATLSLTGCGTTTASQHAQVAALADLGTTGALIAYPQYRPAMQAAQGAFQAVCNNTNGVNPATVEQILAQNGVTNQAVQLGIAGVGLLVDALAADGVTNGIPAEQTIQQFSCDISTGMGEALGGVAAKAPKPAKRWYYLWLK